VPYVSASRGALSAAACRLVSATPPGALKSRRSAAAVGCVGSPSWTRFSSADIMNGQAA
jgi:hypothetical protein